MRALSSTRPQLHTPRCSRFNRLVVRLVGAMTLAVGAVVGAVVCAVADANVASAQTSADTSTMPAREVQFTNGVTRRIDGRIDSRLLLSADVADVRNGAPRTTDRGISARLNAELVQPAVRKTQHAPWTAPVASLLVPGAGQGLLRQQRSVAYVVAEAFLVLRATRAHRDYKRVRDEYRGLAADLARAAFGADRPVGPWEYYEAMERFVRSGNYNSGTGGQFIPETDTSTYNGKQWELARGQYWADPNVPPAAASEEYKKAIELYQRRAYSGSFQWSWTEFGLNHNDFREKINEANQINQRYVTGLGLVAANHLVSLIDSYITVRLRRYGGAGLSTASLTTELRPMGNAIDRQYGMRVNLSIPVTGPR